MAVYAWKDISAVSYNSTDLKAWTRSITGIKQSVTLDPFHPPGIWDTPTDTGERVQDPIVIEFEFDGAAGSPNLIAALGTSAALSITLATGQSVSGTFIVSDVEVAVAQGANTKLTATFTPTGAIVTDYTT